MVTQQQHMRWSELLARAGLETGSAIGDDPIITSVVEDSRQALPGACFVAMRGYKVDGNDFVENAIRAGASAVIAERSVSLPDSVPQLNLQNARGIAGRLAAALYGLDRLQREGRLRIAGITGTNGKSTFCYLLRGILKQAGSPTAMLGTIQYDLLSRKIESSLTTPPAATLMSYLSEAVQAGATHAVMEVSSIALDQGRCDGVNFNVAVFSNLTGDHLDYHGDMDAYLRAKKRLFDGLAADATAVINADDPAAGQMVADCRARILRFGIQRTNSFSAPGGARLMASVREMTAAGTRFDLVWVDEEGHSATVEVASGLVGLHNVQNCLAAAAAALGLGMPLAGIARGLASVNVVPGRLQRVSSSSSITVLVDYAHTDDALINVLSALRPLTTGQLIVLFGCGGDRDSSKRPRMAKAAARFADRIVVTSDNPRTENPQKILSDIMAGFDKSILDRVVVESDRREAIARAISMGDAGDVVLLAGKGHENYQIIGNEKLAFDDAVVASEVLSAKTA